MTTINPDEDSAVGNGSDSDSNLPPGNPFSRLCKQFWYLVVVGSGIALVDLIKDIFVKTPVIEFDKIEKRTNQVAVMTGGPRGIGYDIVKKILMLDMDLILGVRNIAASEKGIESIRNQGVTSGRVRLLQLDLKSLDSVRQFANEVLASPEAKRIDMLLNNAGIMNVPYEKTVDGFESQFQVNYLSHFLLTNLLLPRIKDTAAKKSDPCYIVNTSSHAQRGGSINFDELETCKVYSAVKSYFDSKLSQVIHTKTLETKFQKAGINIHAFAVHPGEIPTDLWQDLGLLANLSRPVVKHICRTTDGAANTVLYPVLTPEVASKHGGEYFESGRVKPPNPQVLDVEIQEKLWERSLHLTNSPDNLKS